MKELRIDSPRERLYNVSWTPIVSHVVDERWGATIWNLDLPFYLKFRYKKMYYQMRVGYDFKTDFTSNKWYLWSISGIAPRGVQDPAVIAHDVLYRTKGGRKEIETDVDLFVVDNNNVAIDRWWCDRKTADIIMYRVWKLRTKYKPKAMKAYTAVRMAGHRHFGGPCPSTIS